MNKRIKQLANEAGFPEWSNHAIEFELEQFAKLIDTLDVVCYYDSQAQVAKLVDAPDLGSGVEICVGSSPTLGTKFCKQKTYRGKTPVALRSDAYLLVQLSG